MQAQMWTLQKRVFTTGKLRSHMMSVHLKERPTVADMDVKWHIMIVVRRHHERKKHGQIFSIKEPTEV